MKAIAMIALIALMATAGAATVTLTGTCPSQVLDASHNVFTFNLTNSGNGTATNFYLAPVLSGMSTYNSLVTIPVVGPGSSTTFSFYTSNFSMPGGYADYLLASYSQGSQTFTTFFPCLLYVGQVTQSAVQVTSVLQSGSTLNVTLMNFNTAAINASVRVLAPPSFAVPEPNASVSLGPHQQKSLSFNVTPPALTGATFPIGVSASYSLDGLHYATISQTIAALGSVSGSSAGISAIDVALAAAIIVIVLLLAVSIVKKRKRKEDHKEERKEEG